MTIKTPAQIARETTTAHAVPAEGRRRDEIHLLIVNAINTDRVQRERAERLRDGEARFTVQFDPEVWPTLHDDEQQDWINQVHDAIQNEGLAYITYEEVGR